MARTAFSEKELQVRKMKLCGASEMIQNSAHVFMPDEEPEYDRPISEKENFRLFFEGETPYWKPIGGWAFCDINVFRPRFHPDNVACHIICDGEGPYPYESDAMMSSWFDLEWVYVPVAGGATVRPGQPKIEDMNDWEELITMPDLGALDWASVEKNNKAYLDTSKFNQLGILCGFWERLMSLMDVEGAAIAMIDEDQQDAVKSFFDRYADLLIDYIERVKACCPIDGVLIHDDWGHQNSAFFSLDTAMEMLVPYLKRVTDAVHAKGMYFELHSCGKNEELVPAYIAAGVDLWCPQGINDIDMLAERYKDQPIAFGQQKPVEIPQDAQEDEIEQIAREWFEKYKDKRVIGAFTATPPAFIDALYKVSRIGYGDC